MDLTQIAQALVEAGFSCFSCGKPSEANRVATFDSPEDGIPVAHHRYNQWVYFNCPHCSYQTSWKKRREITEKALGF